MAAARMRAREEAIDCGTQGRPNGAAGRASSGTRERRSDWGYNQHYVPRGRPRKTRTKNRLKTPSPFSPSNTTEKDPHLFGQQVQIVCQCYQEAPELYFQHHTHTVSVDEMTGVQALERNAKTIPMKPGQPARIEFEYTRHGTLCLIGNWHVVLGQMIAPTIRPTRTEEDFCWHIHHTVATDLNAGWIFVVDNLNTHCSESLVRYVARLEGIEEMHLGPEGQIRHLEVDGDPSGFSLRPQPSDSFRVLAETQFVVEPD